MVAHYLSASVIDDIALSWRDVELLVTDLFRAQREGKVVPNPRTAYGSNRTARFLAFPAVIESESVAGVKWLGLPQGGYRGHDGRLSGVVLVNDAQSGALKGILNAEWITSTRTAVVSLIAARRLARADSRRIAFIGCGQLASLHLDMFRTAFQFETVVASGRTSASVERFLFSAARHGLKTERAASNQECAAGADIVISTTSSASSAASLVNLTDLKPGCFVSHVDLGRSFSWPRSNTTMVVDDTDQFSSLVTGGQLGLPNNRVIPLSELLVTSEHAFNASEAIHFIPTGWAVADIALANRLLSDALAREKGLAIPE
jgi:ornithine cyclodeaminase/alanine dehydrogenase-like protein (mu-crystallin family)